MKKYLLLLSLSAIALVGAGCAGQTNAVPTTQAPAQPESASTNPVKSNDLELTFETDETEKKTDSNENATEDVPVVDIILGDKSSQKINMEAGNFFFSPNTINAKPGDKIKITFTKNVGFHTFVIDEIDVKYAIKQGESLTFTTPSSPGSYAFYCDVGSHRAMGMEGVLIVK